MIKITYNKEIKIESKNLSEFLENEQLPLKFQFTRPINQKILWETEIGSHSWVTFPDTEMVDVIVKDNKDNKLIHFNWDVMMHGDIIYKKFYNFFINNSNKKHKGLVVGTHNGEFGEWVPVAMNRLSDMILIEASQKQYDELINSYSNYDNLKFIKELVTVDGEETIFYEGGKGYTNTVLKRVIDYWEKDEITQTLRDSLKFSDLITEEINWLHLDCEGIDYNLIMSLDDKQIKQLEMIVFEYNNSSEEERRLINDYLINKGFETYRERGVSIAIRK